MEAGAAVVCIENHVLRAWVMELFEAANSAYQRVDAFEEALIVALRKGTALVVSAQAVALEERRRPLLDAIELSPEVDLVLACDGGTECGSACCGSLLPQDRYSVLCQRLPRAFLVHTLRRDIGVHDRMAELRHLLPSPRLPRRTLRLLGGTFRADALVRGFVESLCRMESHRDPETWAHINRVAQCAGALAREAQRIPHFAREIDAEFIENLVLVTPLHDIGKATIPQEILRKPGKLTAEEFEVVKRHTSHGADMIRGIISKSEHFSQPELQMAEQVCESHHERWDGIGYPKGLSGEEIPLAARIVGLVDFYDALSFPRVYRPFGHPHEKVMEEIRGESGKRFDPALVACSEAISDVLRESRQSAYATQSDA